MKSILEVYSREMESALYDEQQAHQQTIRVMSDEIQILKAKNALIAESYKRAHEEVIRLRMEMRRGEEG